MTPEIVFILGVLVFTSAIVAFILKSKNNKESKKSRLKDIAMAIGMVIVIATISAVISTLFGNDANATDLKIFDRATLHAGLQYPATSETNICTPGENQIASDLAIQADLLTYRDVIGAGGAYTHNSCAAGSDEDVYDGAGFYGFVQPVKPLLLQAGVDWDVGNSTACSDDNGKIFNGRVNLELYRYHRLSTGVGYTIHKCLDGPGTEYQGVGLYLKLDIWDR